MDNFTLDTATQEPGLDTAMKVVYQWNYDPEVDELRRLYHKATEAQWIAEREIDWDRPIDHAKFATTPLGCPSDREDPVLKSPDADTVWELTRRTVRSA
jgi:hypothetical protein